MNFRHMPLLGANLSLLHFEVFISELLNQMCFNICSNLLSDITALNIGQLSSPKDRKS